MSRSPYVLAIAGVIATVAAGCHGENAVDAKGAAPTPGSLR